MNITYEAGYYLAQNFFDTLFPGDVRGLHHIPREGGFLLAANHASFFDPPAIGCRLPRKIHYLARKTLFKKGLIGKILETVQAIPIDRDGDSDIGAMKKVIAALRSGEGVILFPEGTRTPDGSIQEAKSGLGMIACRGGVPVVPTRIFGSFDAYSRRAKRPSLFTPIEVTFGKPLPPTEFDPGGPSKKRYQEATNRIMERIKSLPPPNPSPYL